MNTHSGAIDIKLFCLHFSNFHNKLDCFVPGVLFKRSLTNTQASHKKFKLQIKKFYNIWPWSLNGMKEVDIRWNLAIYWCIWSVRDLLKKTFLALNLHFDRNKLVRWSMADTLVVVWTWQGRLAGYLQRTHCKVLKTGRLFIRCFDNQHNDTQHIDIQHNSK